MPTLSILTSRRALRALPAVVLGPAVAAGLALFAAPAAPAQEPEPETVVIEGIEVLPAEEIEVSDLPSHELAELRAHFDEALAVFRSVDQSESEELFGALIERLSEPAVEGAEARRRLLALSHAYRAEVRFNLGDREGAAEDLRAALRTVPSFEPDANLISPKLAELFREVRDEVTGTLALEVEPAGALVLLDGEPAAGLAGAGPVRLLAGVHVLEARRPGFAPFVEELELAPGADEARDVTLERTSATLRLLTDAPGAEVLVDGRPAGVTAPPVVGERAVAETAAPEEAGEIGPGVEPPAAVEPAAPAAGPAELFVEGLALGEHRIEVRKEGFRPHAGSLLVEELTDYRIGPLTLEPTGGTVVLAGLPDGAEVRVDDEVRLPRTGEAGGPTLELPVGRHRLTVDRGTLGGFLADFDLADRQVLELEVDLRPKLCLLDVLGGDLDAAQRVRVALAAAFADRPEWLFADRYEDAAPLLDRLALTAAGLRAAAAASAVAGVADWPDVQRRADAQLACSAYALGVLSDDLYASAAELWVWAAAPGPARPEPLAVRLSDPGSFAAAAARFAHRPPLTAAWLGADLLFPPDLEGAVVRSVTPGGPAARAGLVPGDVLAGVGPGWRGRGGAEPGPRTFRVETGDTAREVAVDLGASPRMLEPDRFADPAESLLLPAVAAWWAIAGEGGGDGAAAATEGAAAPWVVGLNRAAGEMSAGDWASAVRTLRGLRAPDRPGLGRGTIDYWLGVALLAVDPAAYRDEARAAFARAAAAPAARLQHDDGPAVASRARLRLQALTLP